MMMIPQFLLTFILVISVALGHDTTTTTTTTSSSSRLIGSARRVSSKINRQQRKRKNPIIRDLSPLALLSSKTTTAASLLLRHQDHPERTTTVVESIPRGGGGGTKVSTKQSATAATTTSKRLSPTNVITAVFVAGVSYFAYQQRDAWVPLLLDKKKLQQAVVNALEGLRPPTDDGNHNITPWQHYRGYLGYTLGMTVWETMGLSTIPVETAAGMVFGWAGAACSATGKLAGASIAFWVGRRLLRQVVQDKLAAQYPLLQMMENQSAQRHHPLLSALLMKFSAFPETIKNYGTAAFLPSVNFATFWWSTFCHGVTFTLLWTWLGVETAEQLETATAAAGEAAATATTTTTSFGLQLALGAMLVCGFILSPLSMAWWVRDLRKGVQEDEAAKNKSLFGR